MSEANTAVVEAEGQAPEPALADVEVVDVDHKVATPDSDDWQPPDIGPPPEGEWTFDRGEVVDYQFKMMEAHFGELATDLQSEWGADAGRNMQFAAAAAQQFQEHFPDVLAVAEKHNAGNDPMVVELLAVLGRQWAETPGDPGSVRLFPNASGTGTEFNMTGETEFEDKIATLREKARQANAVGDSRRADRLSAEERKLYERRPSSDPAIGPGTGIASLRDL